MSELIQSEAMLVGAGLALGAAGVPGWSAAEATLARAAHRCPPALALALRSDIRAGGDPLGDAFCALRSASTRRARGATYTPESLVAAMVAWGAEARPARVVDPGTGSGRFLVSAGRRLASAELVGVEVDPVAAILARAHLAAAGLAARARVVVGDYRELSLAPTSGSTLFLGNPPYLRHHGIEPRAKQWLVDGARSLGLGASRLAGAHVHFFLATALLGRSGDRGVFVTAAEWLDVNYGRLVRELFLGPLGGRALHLIAPSVRVFDDAETTSVISCFELGARPPTIQVRRVDRLAELAPLAGGVAVMRARLESSPRWSTAGTARRRAPAGYLELGEVCRVHRGQVTGANAVWIAGAHSVGLPAQCLFPCVTRARELFAAGPELVDPSPLARVIDLPRDLDELTASERRAVERFLRHAAARGADSSYVARHRRPWWTVGLRAAAPILATYMARRAPAFVRNHAGARHINVVHGLYPRAPLPRATLDALARYLAAGTDLAAGRTYAGGLVKFEPREMERLPIPGPDLLAAGAW